jgi:hypothetical protein
LIAVGSLFSLALVAGGVLVLGKRRSSVPGRGLAKGEALGATEEEGLAAAAAASLVEVGREADARRAIIACYAQMERSLARAGMARRPSETPLEYLGRVLLFVAPLAGEVLTELFERAMFSQEPMGEHEKERAIEALRALRQVALA